MKIILEMKDFLKIFSQYEKSLISSYDSHMDLLKENKFKIDKIKDKKQKVVFDLQLGTKVDFGYEVIKAENLTHGNLWELKNFDIDSLTALMLRDDKIIIKWEEKTLNDINPIDYLNANYQVKAEEYESKNYIGEGVIDWEKITNDVKSNWENSFFFLDQMNDEDFVLKNKQLILEKTKERPEILKEALSKSIKFFEYAMENLPLELILTTVSENQGLLATVWNNKIKKLFKNIDHKEMLENAKKDINREIESYLNFSNNKYNSYGGKYDLYDDEYKMYELVRVRLNKELKIREKEIIKEANDNKVQLEKIKELLKNENLKNNIIKGLLKNNISREDFIYFEKEIINSKELRDIVLYKGLYETFSTTKNFVEALDEEELYKFSMACNKKIESSHFSIDNARQFAKIISEEKLLSLLQSKEHLLSNFKIFSDIKPKNSELKKYLYKLNPKERFEDLNKNEITEEDIKIYINAEGYLNEVKSKCNVYELKDIETIKAICEKHNGFLNNKKVPNEWKENKEIILAVLKKNSLEGSNLSKANILELSKDIEFVKEVVSKDKSMCFYKSLPDNIKINKKVSLNFISSCEDIEKAIKEIPQFVLSDKTFNIEMIKNFVKTIKHVKREMWNDKEFVLTLFSEIEGTDMENQVRKNLPENIQFFLETFNIKENLYTFFNNYYLQKKLESKLTNEDNREKVKKMKI